MENLKLYKLSSQHLPRFVCSQARMPALMTAVMPGNTANISMNMLQAIDPLLPGRGQRVNPNANGYCGQHAEYENSTIHSYFFNMLFPTIANAKVIRHPKTSIAASFHPNPLSWKNNTMPPSTNAVKASCERLKKYPASFSRRVRPRPCLSANPLMALLHFTAKVNKTSGKANAGAGKTAGCKRQLKMNDGGNRPQQGKRTEKPRAAKAGQAIFFHS